MGALGAFFACAPTASDVTGPGTGQLGAGADGQGGSSGGSGPGGSGGSGDWEGVAATSGDPRDNPDAGCVSTPSAAEQITTTTTSTETTIVTTYSPLDMYIMYDKSGSMGGDRWEAVKAAVTGFVNSPENAGTGVGIQYFPYGSSWSCSYGDPDCSCWGICPTPAFSPWPTCFCARNSGGSCNVADYATPDVPIQLLPDVAPLIVASLDAHSPGGGTPTRPALEGAHQYAAQWATANPGRKTIVVLATDGDPTGCADNSVQDSANVAAAALAGNPSVMTFVIGVGNSLTSLNAIAQAGGSGDAIIVDDSSGDPTQQFIDALNAIRDAVTSTEEREITETITEVVPVPCEWAIPDMPSGVTFDKERVNVEFKAGASGSPQPVGFVQSEAECANVEGGWHFDNYADPKKVLVCDQTCTTIQSIADARVNVVFGCPRVPALPH
jgi:Mg-chelatase subunit ChlD